MDEQAGIDIKELKNRVKGCISKNIVLVKTVESTNSLAMELADKGAVHGTVVIADAQTGGRGRLNRIWVSPPAANIYMSLVLRPSMDTKKAGVLTLMSAVACAKALRYSAGIKVEIKWPNDLVVADKKLGGILAETRSLKEKTNLAIIGIGINVNTELGDFPPEIRRTAVSLKEETGMVLSRTLLISAMLNELESWYNILMDAGAKPVLEEWKSLTSTLNRPVRVICGKETLAGIAQDIDSEGALILRLQSGLFRKITTGDVTHLRTEG